MKIKITKDAHHRISSGKSLHFRASDNPIDVPNAIGKELIEREVAVAARPNSAPAKAES